MEDKNKTNDTAPKKDEKAKKEKPTELVSPLFNKFIVRRGQGVQKEHRRHGGCSLRFGP